VSTARGRGVLPKGAGGVRCSECGATAAADGRGSPIVLKHAPTCSESPRAFAIGDRVRINYGPGTIVGIVEDTAGLCRPPIYIVHADAGQAWFRAPEKITPLDGEAA
jgi:hypothetical protein